jgi:hypothetical protein
LPHRATVLRVLLLLLVVAAGSIPLGGSAPVALATMPAAPAAQAAPALATTRQTAPVALATTQPVSGTWDTRLADGPRTTGLIDAMVIAPNGDRYINASMLYLNDQFLSGMFQWHAGAWSQIAAYTQTASITAMVWGHDSLYVAGTFSAVGGVAASRQARWNGQQWSAVGSGVARTDGQTPQVSDLAFDADTLYIGGYFTSFNGVAVKNLARWDGTTASALGDFGSSVSAVAADGGKVYVLSGSTLMRWDGVVWFNMAAGLNYPTKWPEILMASAGRVFAVNGDDVFEWNGAQWAQLGPSGDGVGGGRGNVTHLALVGNTLYAGLELPSNYKPESWYVAEYALRRWNGATWDKLARNVASITALDVGADGVYLSGVPRVMAPATTALWRWDGADLLPLEVPLEGMALVSSLAVAGDTAYLQATYQYGDRAYSQESYNYTDVYTASALLQWHAGDWASLWPRLTPPFTNATLGPITVGDDGGLYGIAELGNNSHQIVGYDASQWFTVTLPLAPANPEDSGFIFSALHVISPTAIYLAGTFFPAGPGEAYVAFWNGTAWSKKAVTQMGFANELTMCGSQLYFLTWSQWPSGYITPKQIYALNPTTLASAPVPLPISAGSNVSAVACMGDSLYLGGYFKKFSPPPGEADVFYNLIRWNGSITEGITVDGSIDALAVRGSLLYAGGQFSAIDGVAANNIARWDGATWQALGGGVTGPDSNLASGRVTRLAVSGADLYVGGQFMQAGGQRSRSLAVWHEDDTITAPSFTLFLPLLSR